MKNEERWKQRYYRQKTELKRLNRVIAQHNILVEKLCLELIVLRNVKDQALKNQWTCDKCQKVR